MAKKLAENEAKENMSLTEQENMSIKGQSARQLVMQKLMRNKPEVIWSKSRLLLFTALGIGSFLYLFVKKSRQFRVYVVTCTDYRCECV